MIHISLKSLAKIRVNDAKKSLEEIAGAVHLLGKGHCVNPAIQDAIAAVERVEDFLDRTYGN